MRKDTLNAVVVWLLDMRWGSVDYRFSTYPIDLNNGSTTVSYIGGLNDPAYEERLDISTGTAEANSIALELVFDLDLVDQWLNKGRTLEGATAYLSYVTVRNGKPVQTYAERVQVFSGVVVQPIFGSPDRPVGHVAFSVDRPTLVQRRSALPGRRISFEDFNLAHSSAVGRPWIFVWGEGTNIVMRDRNTSNYITSRTVGTSPAYLVNFVAGSRGDFADTQAYLMIAGHDVVAEEVRVIDYKGNVSPLKTVQKGNRGGQIYSYVVVQKLNFSGTVVDNITNPLVAGDETEQPQYWIYWPPGEGAYPNSSGQGALAGAGDVILKLLQQSAADVDINAWFSVRKWLNSYRLQGYLNDPTIDPYEYILDELLPLLPIYIQQGPNGARPVVRHIDNYQLPPSKARLHLNEDVYQISALQPILEPSEIVNRIQFRFGWRGFSQSYRADLTIGAEVIDNPAFDLEDGHANSSQSLYGVRERVISTKAVYDYTTAVRMASDIIRRECLPIYSMQVQTGIDFGWLYLGDVVTLLGGAFNNYKAQIIGKTFNNGWVYELSISQSSITNQRHT